MSSISEDNKNDNDQRGDGSDEITLSKKECTSCEQNNINNITKGIDRVDILSVMSTCACCGKDGNSDDMNSCNKCKSVKYCNAACKKKHRTKHKKACERRVAELHDEQLFKDHPPNEECPICFLVLPKTEMISFQSCCGMKICNGCIYAMDMSGGKDLCAFCRTPKTTSIEENLKRTRKLTEAGNAEAYYMLAGLYLRGIAGLSRDMDKANELLLKAGELGCAGAYFNLGNSHASGRHDLEVDMNKAINYWELAAMMGDLDARYNLGREEYRTNNNHRRAMRHFFLAARAGEKRSLDINKSGFMHGSITKDEYASTLRAYHERQKEMTSEMRDKAAAAKAQS